MGAQASPSADSAAPTMRAAGAVPAEGPRAGPAAVATACDGAQALGDVRVPTPAGTGPLTWTQVLGSKSGQVMLETEEMSWSCIFGQLKKVQLFRESLLMSPGCGAGWGVLCEAWQEPRAAP